MHRQIKTTAEFFHGLDRVKTLLRVFAQAFQIRHQQVGIGLMMAAAHATTQLVQLRQAEFVGAAHDDGVGGGHVNAGLDDGRAQ